MLVKRKALEFRIEQDILTNFHSSIAWHLALKWSKKILSGWQAGGQESKLLLAQSNLVEIKK